MTEGTGFAARERKPVPVGNARPYPNGGSAARNN